MSSMNYQKVLIQTRATTENKSIRREDRRCLIFMLLHSLIPFKSIKLIVPLEIKTVMVLEVGMEIVLGIEEVDVMLLVTP